MKTWVYMGYVAALKAPRKSLASKPLDRLDLFSVPGGGGLSHRISDLGVGVSVAGFPVESAGKKP